MPSPLPGAARTRRPRRPLRRRTSLIAAATLLTTTIGLGSSGAHAASAPATGVVAGARIASPAAAATPGSVKARAGVPRSGLPWHSGVWLGGKTTSMDTAGAQAWGSWRGAPVDSVTVYPEYFDGWDGMARSRWAVDSFAGFPGLLLYGLPMIPYPGGTFAEILDGSRDGVFTAIGQDLATHSGAVIVRIGWEAQGEWMPWYTTATTAPDYRAAFRRIAGLVKAQAPQALIDFDINCVTPLKGQRNRLDSLNLLYPGDDVVDIVGCDHFDWWTQKASNEAAWAKGIRPADSPGLADVAEFARAHGKGMSIPEWGLAAPAREGLGDNALYIQKMRAFMAANADIMVVENYWDDPSDVGGGLMGGQNPSGAAAYRATMPR
ncbi:MAG: hypothetical protein IPK37_11565 [Austwickia sp.]|nr:MAG: hypothetical protein IPK37_11565 [Austwickia sp.]